MAGYILPINNALQYFTDGGIVLAGGKLYTYNAGTTTPIATYTDSTLVTPNANPIVLDSYGRLPNGVWVPGGQSTKVVVKTSAGVAVGPTLDNLTGINDPDAAGTSGDITDIAGELTDLRNSKPYWCGTFGGSADALTGTPTPAFSAYQAGQFFAGVVGTTNATTTPTLNISGIGTRVIKKNGASGLVALAAGDMVAGNHALFRITLSSANAILENPFTTGGASSASAQGSWGSKGLACYNNAGTPNTKLDMTASQLTLWSPSDGTTIVKTSPASKTNDIGAASPAADARDQGAAFTDPSFIHFYWILKSSDGTLASLSSAVAPPTGPTLPTGYTHWCYAGAIWFAGGALTVVRIAANKVYRVAAAGAAVATFTSTVEASASLTQIVPSNALSIGLHARADIVADGVGVGVGSFLVRLVTGTTFASISVETAAASVSNADTAGIEIPNIGQAFFGLWGADTNLASKSASVHVNYFTVPNGAT